MSRTPEVIISKPRKLLNRLVGCASAGCALLSVASFLQGGPYLLLLIAGLVLAFIADSIKFKYVKTYEEGGYKLV
ncbi:hypothetical protein [Hyphomicrobium sp. NDB2Meth4]|uniref:hypothetical protein n=1 Tax=Hyphomicrobium sp. NDB2Meth4 TaxID=1892846 RepID=UPI0009309539|nr:hypothetical protein [Hyphomicrobium sp. NDB2Meth4]